MLMGRIYSGQGQTDMALQSYQDSTSADGTNSDAQVNLGQMLMKLGKPAQAQEAFQAASGAGNNVATMLLANAVNMQNLAANKEKQASMNKDIKELVKRYKSGKVGKDAAPVVEWTSRPMTLTLLDFNTKGKMAMMEGEGDYLELAIIDALNSTGRVSVVEREMIDQIVSELNLSSSDLVNKETRLRLGKLFSARIIATGSLTRYGDETQPSLRLIDTETSLVKISVSPIIKGDPKPSQIADTLKNEIISKITAAYPLRALIADVESDETTVVINIGSREGVKKGTKMKVLSEQIVKVGDKELTKRTKVADLEVTQVEEELAYGKISNAQSKVAKDMKLEEVVK
jgi:hypothetical protein